MYEELQIVRATEDTEDDLKASVKQLGNTVTEADQMVSTYSCNKITTTWIQISRQNWNGFFSNASYQIMI